MALPTLTELAAGHGFTAGDLNTDGYVAAVPAYQKIYFADGRLVADGGYHKLDFINTRLVGAPSGAFTRGEIVTQAVSGAKGVLDETVGAGATAWNLVYRTTTTEFDATNVVTGADSGETLTPTSVVAPPHWLDWTLDAGNFPDGGSNIMALCFGRIFMNDMFNPHHWYATRAGDPLDLLMSQSDAGTACSSQTSKAGLVGDEITAFIPYKDHYLLFGCANEMWVLRSDPAAGGVLTNVSETTGIFSSTSWCWDDKNNLFFVGTDGVYGISADAIINAQPPENLTKEHLPQLVSEMGLNRRTDRITMEYDKDRYGILISVAQMDGAWSTAFWLDLRTKGIFPETYQSGHVPASMLYFDSRRADYRGLMCGGHDGYIRKFDETEKSDDGANAIDSWVTIGPMTNNEDPRAQLKLTDLSIVTGINTDHLEVSLYLAKTAGKLIENIVANENPQILKVFNADKLLPSIRQGIRGGALGIKLSNSEPEKSWSIEKITARISKTGRIK